MEAARSVPPGGGHSAPVAPARLGGLGNRFVELFARRLSRQDFATEIARLVADGIRAKAVAVFGYDSRRDRLLLLGDEGLRPDARAALGGGGECPWDIPLRGLRNRRISVIAGAHQNPFVPRALASLSPTGLSIASLPIYADYDPAGVVLVFAVGRSPFADAQLQTLSQALRVCAPALREADATRPVSLTREGESAEATIAKLIAQGAIIDAAAAAAALHPKEPESAPRMVDPALQQQADDLIARVQGLERELAKAQEELERSAHKVRALQMSSNALARERDGLAQQLADIDGVRTTEATELRAELAATQDRLLAVESERARYQRLAEGRHTAAQQAIKSLEGERETLRTRAQDAESSVAGLQTELGTVRAERERLAAQAENLTGQVRAGQETLERTQTLYNQERTALEADRDGWKEEAATVRAQLAHRTETLAAVERDLRSTVVARDAATSQLAAAHVELERLTALGDELDHSSTQLEAARAAAVAEATTLRGALEEERAGHRNSEQTLQATLAAAQAEAERLASDAEGLRAELGGHARAVAERDEQLARLRHELEAARQADTNWQQADAALRSELTTLSAQIEQVSTERQQLLNERASLRAALVAARQRSSEADVAHAATLGQLQAEAVELRRQVDTLGSDRAALTERLQLATEEGRTLTRRLAETQRRADELSDLLRQRDTTLGTTSTEREQLAAQLATLTGQLRAAQEALERAQARAAQERTAVDADRAAWEQQSATLRTELAQRTENLVDLERNLRAAIVARDVAASELTATRQELTRMSAVADELRNSVTQLEAERDAAAAGSSALRHTLESERAGRRDTERALRADLTAARTEAERLAAAASVLRSELDERTRALAERDELAGALHKEIESLRQESADRGVLAHHASELGTQVVELEQQLAAVRGNVARAERQYAAVTQELEAARRQQAEAAAIAAREQTVLHEGSQRLIEEIRRLEADKAALQGELHAQRAAHAELEGALDQTRTERARAQEDALRAARQSDELTALLRQRDATIEAATADRQKLSARIETLRNDLRGAQQAAESAQANAARERAAVAADRDGWQTQAAAARADVDRLSALVDQLRDTASTLESSQTATSADNASLRTALEQERAKSAQATTALQTDLAALQATAQQLSAGASELRGTLAERDRDLAALRQERDAAQAAAAESQHATSAFRLEVARLSAQVNERIAECQQLRDERAAVEHQLALVTAAHGEEEETLAQGLQAAREQVAQLEHERASLQAAVAESRQQFSETGTAHAATVAQLQADATELRKQIAALKGAGSGLTQRLERAEQALLAQSERTDAERQHAAALAERCAQLEHTVAAGEAQRTTLDSALAQARGELTTATAEVEAGAKALKQLRAQHDDIERQLTLQAATRGEQAQALTQDLQTARAQLRQLEEERTALQTALNQSEQRGAHLEAAHAATLEQLQAEAAELRSQVAALDTARTTSTERLARAEQALTARAAAADDHGRRAALLAAQCTQLEQSLAAVEEQRAAVSNELAQARLEIEALRQQSADRGVLAHQAGELGSRVVELEQQLAAMRGEAARAERQRSALAEELETARRLQAQAEVVADRKLATLRDAVDRLTEERRRLEAQHAERSAAFETQRASLTELQAAVDQLRAERAKGDEEGHHLAQRLGEAHKRLEELSAQLRQRDAAMDAAATDRTRLAAQVAKLTGQVRASQEALESAQGRYALERSAAEADRDRWKEQAAAARAEVERLTASADALSQAASQADADRTAAAAENDALRRALEQARADRSQTQEALRADLTTLRAETEREATVLRGLLLEREQQLAALRHEQETARDVQAAAEQTGATLRADLAALHARLQDTTGELHRLRDERDNLERQLTVVAAARGEEAQALSHELRATQTQLRQLEHAHAALQATLDEHRQRASQADAERTATLEQAQADATELRKQINTVNLARTQLREQLERAEHMLAAQTSEGLDLGSRATALGAQCAQLQQALASAEARGTAAGNELAQTRMEIDALRQQSADRGVLAHKAGELGGRVVELEQQLAAMRGEAARTERQRAALAEELEAARRLREQSTAAAEQEHASLRDALQRLTEERNRLEAHHATQQRELHANRTTLAELHAALEQMRDERAQAEQTGQDLAQQLGDTHRRFEEASALLRQRDAAIEAVVAERKRLEDAVRAAEAAAAQLTIERDELRLIKGSAAERLKRHPAGTVDDAAPELDAPLIIERSAPLNAALDAASEVADTAPEAAAEVEVTTAGAGELVLLDHGKRGDEASAVLKAAGFVATLAAPTDATIDGLARRTIRCVMLNLAGGPAAWRALKVLRERPATQNVPILAYLMSPDAQKGFCFGRADFGVWPMEPDRIVEQLTRLHPKLKRLLAVNSDVDSMSPVRERLNKAGISTSIVLDGKQAIEFTTIVAPEAALLHLSPACPGIVRAIAGIRAADATRDLPLLVLLDKAPPREEIFFASTVRELSIKATFQFTSLPSEIARVIA